jgi:hypothetical protein
LSVIRYSLYVSIPRNKVTTTPLSTIRDSEHEHAISQRIEMNAR